MRIPSAVLQEMEARDPTLVAEVRRLQGLIVGLADASGRILGRELAAIAQERGVEAAQAVAAISAEVEAIRAERKP